MKTYITDNFLLKNKTAELLYHDYAKMMPIIDYHCHLSPQEIAEDKHFRSITDLWLDYDHYKWRAMRTAGISEAVITGGRFDATQDRARFKAWAEVLPQALGNPLYHWTHLEMLRYFDIDELLTPENADVLYDRMNEKIAAPNFSTHEIIKKFKVKFIGTTDDPADSLEYHKIMQAHTDMCQVSPSWRPDKALKIELNTFVSYVSQIAELCKTKINSLDDFILALKNRFDFFKSVGCRISDHGLDEFVFDRNHSPAEAAVIFQKALKGEAITHQEMVCYKSYLLSVFGKWYAENNWIMQLHVGVVRNNNSAQFKVLGADSGFDSMGDKSYANAMIHYLDTLNSQAGLPKTILYCLNPSDNELLATMIGNFQGGGKGRIQFGSGWWFNDQKEGMERQMKALSACGLLPLFVGMLTDSRSFLSYPRHEYFRRILCNLIGQWVEEGEAPKDMAYLGKIIQDICYNNAHNYIFE
ncbi:MAG: glucuronate isomerase [Brevinema sp.]